MSKIDELIAQYCPDGVEYKTVWEVTAWDKKFNSVDNYKQPKVRKYKYYLANELKPMIVSNGTIKILTTNVSDLFTSEVFAEGNAIEDEIIAIPWGGNAVVQYYNGKFITSDNRIAVVNENSGLLTKFLYYIFLKNIDLIASFYRGSGIKHPNMSKILDMKVPIPPLPVQEEIVSILDKFTALQAELEAELEARTHQYEYYRNELLSFEGKDVEWKSLKEVALLKTGSRNTVDAILDAEFDFYVRSQDVLKIDGYDFDDKECIITSGDGVGVGKILHYVRGKYALHQRAYRILVNNSLLSTKFLYFYMKQTFYKYIMGNSVSSSVTSLRKPMLERYPIPIPPIEEQERIVGILDKFDALVNDISIGLPAEIQARRQQYEYYRGKLLTFEPLTA
ncbi:restriction endonuclease subunit S [Sphingobacterium sp. LZ4M12]|nr:restriction endonuclease subunit S [Sphingobacterium sp. LZ4M12]